MPRLRLLLLAIHLAAPAAAQVGPDSLLLDPIERLVDEPADEPLAEPSAILDDLQDLLDRPIDLNTATSEDLAVIPSLSPRLALAIVEHRERQGPFRAVAGLLAVQGFTTMTLEEVLPFVTIGVPATPDDAHPAPPRPHSRQLRIDVQQRFQRRLDVQRGYEAVPDSVVGTAAEPSRYLGSPTRIYTRARATLGTYSANITLEKDPGEPFLWDLQNNQFGYDFASAYVAARDVGPVRKVVLGDFVAQFGQGVALWRAGGLGKGVQPVRPIIRRGRGIRPYGSTDENRFFRGLAATLEPYSGVEITAFGSRRFYDARFSEVDTLGLPTDGAAAVSLPQAGLHRTPSERLARNSLGQTLVGAAVQLSSTRWSIGATSYLARFDLPLQRGDQPYQLFDFQGDQVTLLSIFGHYVGTSHHFFGEIARDGGGTVGGVAGVEWSVGSGEALLLVRHFPRDFHSLHGHAFGDRNGATQNESGIYLGADLRPSPRWRVMGYADHHRSPWARFGVPRPSTGSDLRLALEHRPRTWLTFHAQGRLREREIGTRVTLPTGAEMDGLETERRASLRLQLDFVASRTLRMRSRVEGTHYRRADHDLRRGHLLFHDVRWLPFPNIQVDGRLTYFETDGFEARLYQYESDLLGVMTNALLHGRGTRAYLVLTIRPGGRFSNVYVRMKASSTVFLDRHTIGSGLDEIDGNRVRDVGLQIRYRL